MTSATAKTAITAITKATRATQSAVFLGIIKLSPPWKKQKMIEQSYLYLNCPISHELCQDYSLFSAN